MMAGGMSPGPENGAGDAAPRGAEHALEPGRVSGGSSSGRDPWVPDKPHTVETPYVSGFSPARGAPLSPCFDFFSRLGQEQLCPGLGERAPPRASVAAANEAASGLRSLPTRCQVNPATFLGDDINLQWRSTKAPRQTRAVWHP